MKFHDVTPFFTQYTALKKQADERKHTTYPQKIPYYRGFLIYLMTEIPASTLISVP